MASEDYLSIEPYLARHKPREGFGFEEPIYLIKPGFDVEKEDCPRADTWPIAAFPSGEPCAAAARFWRSVCGVIPMTEQELTPQDIDELEQVAAQLSLVAREGSREWAWDVSPSLERWVRTAHAAVSPFDLRRALRGTLVQLAGEDPEERTRFIRGHLLTFIVDWPATFSESVALQDVLRDVGNFFKELPSRFVEPKEDVVSQVGYLLEKLGLQAVQEMRVAFREQDHDRVMKLALPLVSSGELGFIRHLGLDERASECPDPSAAAALVLTYLRQGQEKVARLLFEKVSKQWAELGQFSTSDYFLRALRRGGVDPQSLERLQHPAQEHVEEAAQESSSLPKAASSKAGRKPARRRKKKAIIVHQENEGLEYGGKAEKIHSDSVLLLKALATNKEFIGYEDIRDIDGEKLSPDKRYEAVRNIDKVFKRVGLRPFSCYFTCKHSAGYARKQPLPPVSWKN